jgi:ketosteroid isomerase-like protein
MSSETQQANIDLIRRFYDLALGGRADAAAELLDDERLVIHEPAGLPYGGEYYGIQGWRDCSGLENELVQHELLSPIAYAGVGEDLVLMRVRVKFTSRATGRSTETDVVELLRVRDGKIVEFDVYYKAPEDVAALG